MELRACGMGTEMESERYPQGSENPSHIPSPPQGVGDRSPFVAASLFFSI